MRRKEAAKFELRPGGARCYMLNIGEAAKLVVVRHHATGSSNWVKHYSTS